MADRDNIDDIYKIVKEDFNWIQEDMEQHRNLIKKRWIQCIENDEFEDIDDYRNRIEYIEKLMGKIENIKKEYISIIKGEEDSKKVVDGIEYDYLEDWKGSNPKEILLFGKR